MPIDSPTVATRATASAKFDLGRDEANAGFGVDGDGQAPVVGSAGSVGSALVEERGGSGFTGSSKGASSLDRFLEMMAADDTKKVLLRVLPYEAKFVMVTTGCHLGLPLWVRMIPSYNLCLVAPQPLQ